MSKFPIIVLEGPDGVGKTTLANKLCEYLGGKYVHLTYRFKDKMNVYHGAAMKYALVVAETQPVVIDRWWPSEHVYADVYRGGTRWPHLGRHLERSALRHGVSFVFCLPEDKDHYLKHFNVLKGQREEMYDGGMDRVYEGFFKIYDKMRQENRPGVLRYDLFTDGKDLDDFVQRVLELSCDQQAQLPHYSQDTKFKELSGDVSRAKFLLLIREEPSKYDPMTADNERNRHISSCLDLVGVPESDLATLRVCGPVTDTFKEAAVMAARHMKVVCVGYSSVVAASEIGLKDCRYLPPPTMWDNRNIEYLREAFR